MKYLLDTNICIFALRGQMTVHHRLSAISPGHCAVSTVSRYELMTGVSKCRDAKRERKKVETFLRQMHVLVFDESAADAAAVIRAELENAGSMIGPYDVLLAAQALTQRLTLVTNNRREFDRVHGLRVEDFSVAEQA